MNRRKIQPTFNYAKFSRAELIRHCLAYELALHELTEEIMQHRRNQVMQLDQRQPLEALS